MEAPQNIPRRNIQVDITRQFEDFLIAYEPALVRVENYLEKMIRNTDPAYTEAYIPWKNAIHELLQGICLIVKKIPLPNKESFMDALCMFSFDSTIKFLRDMCNICQLQLKREWEKQFRKDINQLLFSISHTHQQSQHAIV